MGCGSGQKQVTTPIRLRTVTGKLKITITSATIFHQVSLFKMDPYISVRLSNQIFVTKVAEGADKNPTFNQSFNFYVNSCYKEHGRHLQVTLLDKKKVGGDTEIGFGIVDLDPIINFKKPKDEFRCFLNYDRKQAGFVNIVTQFQQQSSQNVSIRFETASIRRKTSTFGDMNCWVQATIGQQVLQTSRQKDTKQMPPVWAKQILTFNVPKSAQYCQIILMDNQTQVGRLKLQVQKLLSSTSEQPYNQQFMFQEQVSAGTLKFQSFKGMNPVFSQIKTIHKKVVQQKKDPKKQQQKKDQQHKKNQDKKEEDKKQENKKQEPKKEQPKKEQPKKQQPKKQQPNKQQKKAQAEVKNS